MYDIPLAKIYLVLHPKYIVAADFNHVKVDTKTFN